MQATNADRTPVKQNTISRYVSIVVILSLLTVIGIYVNNAIRAFRATSQPQRTTVISPATLEEKYGLRVNLVAVTAAGGFVDVRLKIIDGEKSKQLLANAQNFPTLHTEKGVVLNAPEQTKSQEIQFISGGNLFIIYPNSANAVKPDNPVTLMFGDIAVETIQVK